MEGTYNPTKIARKEQALVLKKNLPYPTLWLRITQRVNQDAQDELESNLSERKGFNEQDRSCFNQSEQALEINAQAGTPTRNSLNRLRELAGSL